MSRVRFPRVSLVQELIVSSVDCFADVAELADALDLGSSGRPWGFKSSHPHQIDKNIECKGFKKSATLCFFFILSH